MIVTRVDDKNMIIMELVRNGKVLRSRVLGNARVQGSRRSRETQQAAKLNQQGLFMKIIRRVFRIG